MTDFLSQVVSTGPAEPLILIGAALSVPWGLALRWSLRRHLSTTPHTWPWLIPQGLILWLGIAAAIFRGHSVAEQVHYVPARELLSLTALSIYTSASVLWLTAGAAASSLAVSSLWLPWSLPSAQRARWGVAGLLTSLPLLWLASPWSLGVGAVLVLLVSLGLTSGCSLRAQLIQAGLLLLALMCVAGAEADLYHTLGLKQPAADLLHLDEATSQVWWLRTLAILCLTLAATLRSESSYPAHFQLVVSAAMVHTGVALWWGSRASALAFGPPPGLSALNELHSPPQLPTRLAGKRLAGGCLLIEGRVMDLGQPNQDFMSCPEGEARGHLPSGQIPWLALPAEAPVTDLTGWFEGGAGTLGLVAWPAHTRASWAPWLWMHYPLTVQPAPTHAAHRWVWAAPRQAPLNHAALARLDGDAVSLYVDGAFRPSLQGLPTRARQDLVLLATPRTTVQQLLDTCVQASALSPRGLRCMYGTGDPDTWTTWTQEMSVPQEMPPFEFHTADELD